MFTGIVTHRGRLLEARVTEGDGRRFVLQPEPPLPDAAIGASIAVDGVCLTVCEGDRETLAFDVMPETLRKTTLGERRPGDVVNLERSLRLGDEMGGHMVQGHVEGTARVVGLERQGEDVRMSFSVPEPLHRAMIPKGSVSIDGVSLTVGEVWVEEGDPDGGRFSVYLIPHTLAVTGLGERQEGDGVNVEPDVLGRWVEHHMARLLEREGGGVTPGGPSGPGRTT